jgi:hypothetical protein
LDDVTILNPRRANFPIDNPNEAQTQIVWESYNLNTANAILFWFPKETLCPIVLYELGFQFGRLFHHKYTSGFILPQLFIGAHPEYQRRQDVVIQSKLAGYTGKIFSNLDDLGNAVLEYFNY